MILTREMCRQHFSYTTAIREITYEFLSCKIPSSLWLKSLSSESVLFAKSVISDSGSIQSARRRICRCMDVFVHMR